MREAWRIRELRVPVPASPGTRIVDGIGSGAAPPSMPPMEYSVVEEWNDGTIRHPTTGVAVSLDLWLKDRTAALHILRTEGR